MTAADLVLTDAAVRPMSEPHRPSEAVAIRDGRIVRTGRSSDVERLAGIETRVVDLDGRTVLPGFVDAHTHLITLGRSLVHATLADASGPEACIDRLRSTANVSEWILGFGYDESGWADRRYLTRADLDRVSRERPVVAFREDMHVASVNGVVLDRYLDSMPRSDVQVEDGEPTGVLVEGAVEAILEATEPTPAEMRTLILAAQDYANERGVTAVHDMVRRSCEPRVYREMDRDGALTIRVRINYWRDHLEAINEVGLRGSHGSEFVRTGGVKSFSDGSIGGRTAKVSEPYADGGGTGRWVVDPADLDAFIESADAAGHQVAVHAIGDRAIGTVLDSLERTADPESNRHRMEHVELATADQIARLASLGIVASMQPNFHRWAEPGGLYETRLGSDRRTAINPLRSMREAGVRLAFGSDCMPIGPLTGIHHAVNAPNDEQRLSVTEAIRAYTIGSAYAGFDEHRLGTIEAGKAADLVVLDDSPWNRPASIEEIDVTMTIVAGEIVHDGRR